ncbi:phosphoesterase [Syntrophotalea acetylenivorans]|uniref:Phosphoesterase n=1 Tax=Syntrophotalea acetylenivorans TaxID=1842532 RepID=A0A1L3GKN7_9BACT|nr:DHH family phosphoesterase [Syntrophotalea acetylenivorans]APG26484.1 phosphoesterase [Syntrophotalea acetylenivorans]
MFEQSALQRSREFSSQFIEWLRGKGTVLIVTHDHPDPDSLAAAMALKHLILVKTGQRSTIAYGGVVGRGENRVMVEKLEIELVPLEELDLQQFQVVCMVDTQPQAGNNSLPADCKVDLVIDHHPLRESCRDSVWVDVREDYGASATILLEYLLAQEITICTKLATILFYAIKSETQDLGREWSRADRLAYLHLLPLSNNRILFDIIHPEVPRDYFAAFSLAIRNARIFSDVLVFNLYEIGNPDIVAEMADFLLRVDRVKIVLGMGHYQEDEILSFRTLLPDIRAGAVMQEVVAGLGTAGGHGMIAGGQIRSVDKDSTSQNDLEETLTERLLNCLKRPVGPGQPLVVS